jgi:hypothetical protein
MRQCAAPSHGMITISSRMLTVLALVLAVQGWDAVASTTLGFTTPGTTPTLYPNGLMRRIGKANNKALVAVSTTNPTYQSGEDQVLCVAVDPVGNCVYAGTDSLDGYPSIIKYSIALASAPPVRVGRLNGDTNATLATASDDRYIAAAVYNAVDPADSFAIFCSNNSSNVIKIKLSDFTVASVFVLGEDAINCAALDAANHILYCGTATDPGKVFKLDVGTTAADLVTLVGSVLTLSVGESYPATLVLNGGYLFASTDTTPGIIVKIRLSDFTRLGALPLTRVTGEDYPDSGVVDGTNGFLYYGTSTVPGMICKVAVGAADALPTEAVNPLILQKTPTNGIPDGLDELQAAVIDPVGGYAYFGTAGLSDPAWVVKIALKTSDTDPNPAFVGVLALNLGETGLVCAARDPADPASAAAYGYFGTSPQTGGALVKVSLSAFGTIRGTKQTLPVNATISSVSLYTHAAGAHVRLAIYDSNTPIKGRVWASTPLATNANGLVTADLTATPLLLGKGTYWLCWQMDTSVPVASRATGGANTGMFFLGRYADGLPTKIDKAPVILTNDKWIESAQYDAATISLELTGSNTPAVAGQSRVFHVRALDNASPTPNVVTSYRGRVYFKFLGGAARAYQTVPAAGIVPYYMTVDDAGQKDFTINFLGAGQLTLTATDGTVIGTPPAISQMTLTVLKITTVLTKIMTVGQDLDLTIAAAGGPSTTFSGYDAVALAPDTLAAHGITILNTSTGRLQSDPVTHVTTPGSVLILLTAHSVGSGDVTGILNLLIRKAPGTPNHVPTFASPLPTIDSPIVAGADNCQFRSTANVDSDGDILTTTWSFGDASFAYTATGTHSYMVPKEYVASVTLSDGQNLGRRVLPVSVAPPQCGGLTPTIALTVFSGVLNFVTVNADSVAMTGFLPVTKGATWAGKVVRVTVGTFSKQFSLGTTGNGTQIGCSFVLVLPASVKPPNAPGFPQSVVKFTCSMARQNMADAWNASAPELVNQTIPAPGIRTTLPVTIVYDVAGTPVTYTTTINVTYSCTEGRAGVVRRY